jgi:zinc protease
VAFAEHRLPNGLLVVLAPDHTTPAVAVSLTYNVGSRDEQPGKSGMAHLFEHMMFEGSAHVLPRQHHVLIHGCGGYDNARTDVDRTVYYDVVPRGALALALFLEADRMFVPRLGADSLPGVRRVVEAEKRENHDPMPYDAADTALWQMAYTKFGNTHPTIGTVTDLERISAEDVWEFSRIYYGPNNAALCVAGDFDPPTALALIRRYFDRGTFGACTPPAPDVDEPLNTPIPPERSSRVQRLTRITLPRYYSAWRTPPAPDPDYPALVILSDVLGDGRSSRCARALVDSGLASAERVVAYGRRDTGLFVVSAEPPTRRAPLLPIASVVARVIRRIQDGDITADELERVRNLQRVRALHGRSSATYRAVALSDAAICHGSPAYFNIEPERMQMVTAADVQRVARRWLTNANRIEVWVER